jgi:hypothetical protein
MTVVETPFFLRKAPGLLTDEEREQLIGFVGANPELGDVVPASGGIRKLRWRAEPYGVLEMPQSTVRLDRPDWPS